MRRQSCCGNSQRRGQMSSISTSSDGLTRMPAERRRDVVEAGVPGRRGSRGGCCRSRVAHEVEHDVAAVLEGVVDVVVEERLALGDARLAAVARREDDLRRLRASRSAATCRGSRTRAGSAARRRTSGSITNTMYCDVSAQSWLIVANGRLIACRWCSLPARVDAVGAQLRARPYWIPKLNSSPVAGSQVGWAEYVYELFELAVEVVLAERLERVGVELPRAAALVEREQVARVVLDAGVGDVRRACGTRSPSGPPGRCWP